MLKSFFDVRQDSRDLFHDLDVMNDVEVISNWMNKFPVIYVTFKDIDGLCFESALAVLQDKLSELFFSYRFVADEENNGLFKNILDGNASLDEIRLSFGVLARMLFYHYGKKVIVLIDEYDVPLDKAEQGGYYPQMLDVIRSMFLSVLKDSPYVEKGILTGCLRISKESLFTGLDNLSVYSVTEDEYADAFAFTDKEVQSLLVATGFEARKDVIKRWYDGYQIGSERLYTPWDVLSYVKKLQANTDAEPENYWANSSGNEIIRKFIEETDSEVGDDYTSLIDGKCISKKVTETLTYNTLYSSQENIWSLLLTTGYLALEGKYYPNGECNLRLPNEEVRTIFISSVDEWFEESVRKSERHELFSSIWDGDEDKLSSIVSEYLFRTISYYNYKKDYYHAFLAGLLSGAGYIVKSNRESGVGRVDIIMLDKKERRAAIFEIKRSKSEDAMEKDAELALSQIKEMEYGQDLDGYRAILNYGVAFYKKNVKFLSFK